MSTIPVGAPAPNFSLRDATGRRVGLADFRGRSLVVYFYPEDDTPLCTAEACQFRDHHPDFVKVGCSVVGISPDDAESHAAFAAKHGLPFPLLVDEPDREGNPKVSLRYGAWGEKNMYGRFVRGMIRTTYLIGPDGKVARRWDRVKTPGHSAEVLKAAKALHSGEALTVLGQPKPIAKLSKKAAKPPAKRARAKTGRQNYSGVASTKGKKTRARSTALQNKAASVRVRGKKR
ncbi:MAG: peroxiredoxin [Phycisphaerales bacterium]